MQSGTFFDKSADEPSEECTAGAGGGLAGIVITIGGIGKNGERARFDVSGGPFLGCAFGLGAYAGGLPTSACDAFAAAFVTGGSAPFEGDTASCAAHISAKLPLGGASWIVPNVGPALVGVFGITSSVATFTAKLLIKARLELCTLRSNRMDV